jgi:hypothetical protein
LQGHPITLSHYRIALCENEHAKRHPCWKEGDSLRASTWFVHACDSYLYIRLSTVPAELLVVFNSGDGREGHPTEPTTLFLMITVSANAVSSSNVVVGTPDETMESVTTTMSPLSRRDDLPIESGDPVRSAPDSQIETSRTALRRAEETINTINTWKGAVNVVKWVVDTISPIAAV